MKMGKPEWRTVVVKGREWKFLVIGRSQRYDKPCIDYYLECKRRNEPFLIIEKISEVRVSVRVSFTSSPYLLKPEARQKVKKITRKWMVMSMIAHPHVRYRVSRGRLFNYFDIDPAFLDEALQEFAEVVLDPENWEIPEYW
jgi:hypothetical protein